MAMKQQEHGSDTHRRKVVEEAIEQWYSTAYAEGVRLTGVQRLSLAKYVAQRLGG